LEFNKCQQHSSKSLKILAIFLQSEKALIAHCLISSLDVQHHDNVDQAWAELAQKRFTELKSGKVEGISWNEIKKRIKQHNA